MESILNNLWYTIAAGCVLTVILAIIIRVMS
jgi:hypothetical protein